MSKAEKPATRKRKELLQKLANQEIGPNKKVYQGQNDSRATKTTQRYKDDYEDRMLSMLDQKNALLKLAPILKRLDKGTLDVQGAIDELAPNILIEQMKILYSTDTADKVKLDAIKHLLGVAGYSPSQKHEISRVDPSTPRESILSILRGSTKDWAQADIEIVDDSEED